MNSREEQISNLVKRAFQAYELKDRSLLESLLSDKLVFTSPHDHRIDKATYFERCWPFSQQVRAYHFIKIMVQYNQAFVLYECRSLSGIKFRNIEFFTIEGDKIREIEVYYGSIPASHPSVGVIN